MQDNTRIPVQNPYANGYAWMVHDVQFVNTPNEEIHALQKLDLKKQAVAGMEYKELLSDVPAVADSSRS